MLLNPMVNFLSSPSLTSQWHFTLLIPPSCMEHFLPMTPEAAHVPVFPPTFLDSVHTKSSPRILNTLPALNSQICISSPALVSEFSSHLHAAMPIWVPKRQLRGK